MDTEAELVQFADAKNQETRNVGNISKLEKSRK